jgi:hypothetical protein
MMQALAPAFVLNCRMSLLIDPVSPRTTLRRTGACLLLAWLPLGCSVLPVVAPEQNTTPAAVSEPVPAAPATAPAEPAAGTPDPRPTATAPAVQTPEADTATDAAARRLLAFNERIRDLGPADLMREAVRLGDPADPGNSLELALVLAQTRQSGDLARALALVEPLARSVKPSDWRGLARLMHVRLVEQRRLEDLSERQAQQLREQQRRIDQLSSQIDALRAIERSLNARPALPQSPSSVPSSAPPPR